MLGKNHKKTAVKKGGATNQRSSMLSKREAERIEVEREAGA